VAARWKCYHGAGVEGQGDLADRLVVSLLSFLLARLGEGTMPSWTACFDVMIEKQTGMMLDCGHLKVAVGVA